MHVVTRFEKELAGNLHIWQRINNLGYFLDKTISFFDCAWNYLIVWRFNLIVSIIYMNFYIWKIQTFYGLWLKSLQETFEFYQPRLPWYFHSVYFYGLRDCRTKYILVKGFAYIANTDQFLKRQVIKYHLLGASTIE